MKNLKVFLLLLFIRLCSVFGVQTYFVPDEYWQSIEVAHKLIFGFGYLTWEWKCGIRSYFYPLIFAVFYKILDIFKLDYPEIVIYGPRIIQSIISAYADLCFYQWAGYTKWAVFFITTSWFWFYTSSRTLINTFECALTTIALSQFPWYNKGFGDSCKYMWLVSLLCAIRPTAIITWVPLIFYHFIITQFNRRFLFMQYLCISLIVLLSVTIIDTLGHGSFLISSYEFIKFNVFKNIGSWYGTNPWFWYLSIGLPTILGINFLPFILSVLVIVKNAENHLNELFLLLVIVFTITVYSCFPHKEFRFILQLLPIILVICSRFLTAWSRKAPRIMLWIVAIILYFGNIGPGWYFSFIHQRGSLEAMNFLREIAWKSPHNSSFLFLMPCHSTPYYSHMHINITMRFLTCEPNFNNVTNYIDEADQFYNNPKMWLRKNYPSNGTLPSHIICFDKLRPYINDILSRYTPIKEIFHTSLTSERIGRNIFIHERWDPK